MGDGPQPPLGYAVPSTGPATTDERPSPSSGARSPASPGARARGLTSRRSALVPLRPLTVADILDGAFTAVRRNPRTTLGVALVLALVQVVATTAIQVAVYASLPRVPVDSATGEASIGSAALVGQLGPVISTWVVGAVVGAVLTGMLTVVVTEDVVGRQVDLREVWSRIRPVLGRLVIVSLVAGLGPTIALAFFVAPGILLWGWWAVSVPVLVVERRRGLRSLSRSMRLVKGSFGRVWGIRALGVIVTYVVASLFTVPFLVLAAVLGVSATPSAGDAVPLTYLLITALASVLATTVSTPIRAGVDALLYVDLRIRREGLDIALRLQATS